MTARCCVGLSLCREESQRVDDVVDVGNAPLPVQTLAVGAAVARAAAIVHVGDREPAARPVLDLQVERRPGGGRRPAVADDDERRPLAGGRGEVLVARRVVERVRALAAGGLELHRLARRRCSRRRSASVEPRRSVSTAPDARSTRTTASGCGGRPGDQHRVRVVRRHPVVRHDLAARCRSARRSPDVNRREMPAALARVRHDEPRRPRERPRGRPEHPLRPSELCVATFGSLDRRSGSIRTFRSISYDRGASIRIDH